MIRLLACSCLRSSSALSAIRTNTNHANGALAFYGRISRIRTTSRCIVPNRALWTTSPLCEKVTIKVPSFDDSISQGDVFFDKKVGDSVSVDDRIATIETDKITVPIQAPASGVIVEILAKDGDVVNSESPLVIIDTSGEVVEPKVATSKEPSEPKVEDLPKVQTIPDPRVAEAYRTVLPEHTPKPSDSFYADQRIRDWSSPPSRGETTAPTPASIGSGFRPGHVPQITKGEATKRIDTPVKMSRMRLRISERLKASQSTMATLTTFNEVDMSYAVRMRKKYKDAFQEKHNIKLGFMSVFVQACTHALIEYPMVNAYIEDDHIIYHNYVDISVAVATPKGLVVPVIRDTHCMSMADIERAVFALGQKARENNITIEDMDGGTFTVSNGGVYGGLFGTPIINERQSAILGIYGVKDRPVVIDGKIEIRPMAYVALSYDHRMIDGREAVTFLARIKELVEDPVRCLLDV